MGTTQKFTNSELVSYTKLSPNHSGHRKHDIDRITPHCFVGQVTVERIGKEFAPTSKKASCNYGIAKDGQVALVVDEQNRTWCSSSPDNDNRAVTIECASGLKEPYEFNDKVYEKLILLCADICRRYDKTKILWIADKNKALSYQLKPNEMLLTVHNWFRSDKSCPGQWLMKRMDDLTRRVNMKLNDNSTFDTAKPENEKPIWNFLMSKINNPYGVAGLIGNLYAESGLDPMNLSNEAETSIGVDDEEYTRMVDSGDYANFINDKAGYGLARWWFHTRKEELLYFAHEKDASVGDLNIQLEYLWKELQHWTTVLKTLQNAKTVKEASDAVMLKFLNVSDKGETNKNIREEYGEAFYKKYVNYKEEFKPYKVQVTATSLNCRKGPGTNYPVVATIRNQGVYTIVEEANGNGAKKWGRLKSGIWFSLDYTRRV